MLSGQLYQNFKAMTPEQKDYAMGWFFGTAGMHFEGFTDSASRPEFPYAKSALLQFGNAMLAAEDMADPNLRQARPIQ